MKAFALLLIPAVALAQAGRYNDAPTARPRPPLVSHLDELVARVAKSQRRAVPRPDLRLDAAATEIARLVPDHGPPPNELVQGALWLQGIVEPPPHLVLATMGPGGEGALAAELAHDLPEVLAQGRYARVGIGLAPAGRDTRVLVALQESFLDLEPVARALPLDATVTLRGRLRDGFERPEAFVTSPDGRTTSRIALAGDATRLGGSFRCGPEKGRYQVEVTGDDRFGATVLANFPVYCGVPAPTTVRAAAPATTGGDDRFTTTDAAEHAIHRLLNNDRARAGLPPLSWNGKLADVARAHSADMAAHGFFGHVSPTTGTAADRARRAGVDAMLILENLARAVTPAEAERGLMNSPGHRANILSREATEVGVGVVVDPATHELLVTQLFARPPERFSPRTVDELRADVAALRRKSRVRPLERDAGLDELAQTTAYHMAHDGMSAQQAGHRIEEALGREGARFSSVRSLFAVVASADQVAESLARALGDGSITTAGFGVEPGRRKDGGSGLYVVIVLATKR